MHCHIKDKKNEIFDSGMCGGAIIDENSNELRGVIESVIKPNKIMPKNSVETMLFNNISFINTSKIAEFITSVELGKTEGVNDKLDNLEDLVKLERFSKPNENETEKEKLERRRNNKSDKPKKGIDNDKYKKLK